MLFAQVRASNCALSFSSNDGVVFEPAICRFGVADFDERLPPRLDDFERLPLSLPLGHYGLPTRLETAANAVVAINLTGGRRRRITWFSGESGAAVRKNERKRGQDERCFTAYAEMSTRGRGGPCQGKAKRVHESFNPGQG